MVPYSQKALRQFDNIVPTKHQDSPHPYITPKYGAKQQFAEYDTQVLLLKRQTKVCSANNRKIQLVCTGSRWDNADAYQCPNGPTSHTYPSNDATGSTFP